MKLLRLEKDKYVMEQVKKKEVKMSLDDFNSYKKDREERLAKLKEQKILIDSSIAELEAEIITFK